MSLWSEVTPLQGSLVNIGKTSEIFLSESTVLWDLIFAIQVHLELLYKDLSNYAPGVINAQEVT